MQSQSFNSKSIAYGPVIVRIALAIPLVVSGAGKLLGIGPKASGIAGFAGTLASLGVPVPELFAWIVGAVEFGGGLLILLGLFTRYAAALAAVNMAVATVLVHAPNGFVVGGGRVRVHARARPDRRLARGQRPRQPLARTCGVRP